MSRFLPWIAVAVMLALLAGCATTKPTSAELKAEARAKQYIARGRAALSSGQPRLAAQAYVQAAAKSRQSDVAMQATMLAWQVGDMSRVKQAAQRWHTLEPDNGAPHRYLAIVALQQRNNDRAVVQLKAFMAAVKQSRFEAAAAVLTFGATRYQALGVMKQLQAGHDDNAAAHYQLARLAYKALHTRFARQQVAAALRIRPDWVDALVLRARILIDAGQTQQALAPFKSLMTAAKPLSKKAQVRYAQVLYTAGQHEAARKVLHTVLGEHPQRYPRALLLLALEQLDAGHIERSRRYLTLLLESGQQRSQAYYYLAKLAQHEGKYKRALDWLRRIDESKRTAADDIAVAQVLMDMGKPKNARHFLTQVRRHKFHRRVAIVLGEVRLLRQHGQHDAALKLLNHALETHKDNTRLLYARSSVMERAGKPRQALADIARVVKLEPGNPGALNALGYMLGEHTTEYEKAQAFIAKALHYAPYNKAIIDSYGWVAFRRGDVKTALKALRVAHQGTQNAEISAHLVVVLEATGQKKHARRVLERALKQHPDSPVLRHLKGSYDK